MTVNELIRSLERVSYAQVDGVAIGFKPAFGAHPFGAVEGGVAELEAHVEAEQDDAEVEAEAEAPVGGKAAGEIQHFLGTNQWDKVWEHA